MSSHPFDRSGLASLDDLETSEFQVLFNELEAVQDEFLKYEKQFRSPDYKWPHDPLHTWSRCWEYPYAIHHIRKWRSTKTTRPTIVDLGSGVTFFPFCVAKENCDVVCVDIDPLAQKDLVKASTLVPTAPGSISFKLTDGNTLPFDDCEIDALYCISVLEHIPDPNKTIAEIARVLRSQGLFILTFDIDLAGNLEIVPEKYNVLRETLKKYFLLKEPDITIHPIRVLDSNKGPFPIVPSGWAKLTLSLREIIKQLIGLKTPSQLHLACQGFILIRRGN